MLLAGDLYVTRLTPLGGAGQPFDALEIQFSKEVRDDTFQVAQNDLAVSGPEGPLAPTLTRVAGDRYRVDLSGTGLATYRLTIGPDILGVDDGLAMNQDRNATPGESSDAYSAKLVAGGAAIAADDASWDNLALVVYGNTVTIQGHHPFRDVDVLAAGNVSAGEPGVQVDNLRLDGASTFALAGGSTLRATGQITVAGNSTLRVQGKNTAGLVGGVWAGVGGTIDAA
ncbi:MAG: hypothetical protein MUF25_20640, partial [Pirellulaceae bacterium]|nr:hypothetical protein [Pirellulaceae bacterium]